MITKFLGEKQWPLKQALERRLVAMTLLPEEGEAEIREVAEWGRRPSCDWSTAGPGTFGWETSGGACQLFFSAPAFPKEKGCSGGNTRWTDREGHFLTKWIRDRGGAALFPAPASTSQCGGPSWEVQGPFLGGSDALFSLRVWRGTGFRRVWLLELQLLQQNVYKRQYRRLANLYFSTEWQLGGRRERKRDERQTQTYRYMKNDYVFRVQDDSCSFFEMEDFHYNAQYIHRWRKTDN